MLFNEGVSTDSTCNNDLRHLYSLSRLYPVQHARFNRSVWGARFASRQIIFTPTVIGDSFNTRDCDRDPA